MLKTCLDLMSISNQVGKVPLFAFGTLGLFSFSNCAERGIAPPGPVYTNLHIDMRAWWRLVLQHVRSVPC